MTRETKIGLLVGLAFIIVIGILLSDHLTSTLQPPQAPLTVAATGVRDGLQTPGAGQITREQPMPLPEAGPNPLVIDNAASQRRSQGTTEVTVLPPVSGREIIIPDNRRQPEKREPGTYSNTPEGGGLEKLISENPGEFVEGPITQAVREYKAEPGDTISGIARRYLGADTKANRDAIFSLNPSLKNDPRQLRAGATYLLPYPRETATTPANPTAFMPISAPPQTPTTTPSATTPTAASPASDNLYTIRPGDTLWRIAVTQAGSHAAVQQIRELNRDTLKGGDRLRPGMKLRLPPKPAAASSNTLEVATANR